MMFELLRAQEHIKSNPITLTLYCSPAIRLAITLTNEYISHPKQAVWLAGSITETMQGFELIKARTDFWRRRREGKKPNIRLARIPPVGPPNPSICLSPTTITQPHPTLSLNTAWVKQTSNVGLPYIIGATHITAGLLRGKNNHSGLQIVSSHLSPSRPHVPAKPEKHRQELSQS